MQRRPLCCVLPRIRPEDGLQESIDAERSIEGGKQVPLLLVVPLVVLKALYSGIDPSFSE